jgi:hypothetical protein
MTPRIRTCTPAIISGRRRKAAQFAMEALIQAALKA